MLRREGGGRAVAVVRQRVRREDGLGRRAALEHGKQLDVPVGDEARMRVDLQVVLLVLEELLLDEEACPYGAARLPPGDAERAHADGPPAIRKSSGSEQEVISRSRGGRQQVTRRQPMATSAAAPEATQRQSRGHREGH